MASLKQRDPSRTTTIRNAFERDMRKRFRMLKTIVKHVVADKDVFGLKTPNPLVIHEDPAPRAFEFRTDPAKIEAFREWLEDQVDRGILEADSFRRPWMSKYIDSAYKKGKLRGYKEAFPDVLGSLPTDANGVPIGVSFMGPAATKTLEAIYTRAFNDLRGVSDEMATKMSRILSLGFAQGENPLEIAAKMTREIDNLTRKRAVLIARTETIAAHADGQLDAYEELKVEYVEVQAEWLTAGDDRVCPWCAMQSGAIIALDEARNLIPYHPNCRCAWAPIVREKTR